MENKNVLSYKQKASKSDMTRYFKAVALPFGIFIIAIFTIYNFAGFGSKLVAPLTGVMWLVGIGCALILPSHRLSILRETHATVAIYLISLSAIRELISMVSGVSSEMLMAAFGQAIPLTSGSAFAGWLQNLLYITALMTPLGFVIMQGKKVYSFKRKGNQKETLAQLRNIRNDHHIHTQ